jgi:hypothetical protein
MRVFLFMLQISPIIQPKQNTVPAYWRNLGFWQKTGSCCIPHPHPFPACFVAFFGFDDIPIRQRVHHWLAVYGRDNPVPVFG